MSHLDLQKLYELEHLFKVCSQMIRDHLAATDKISQFSFEMTADGRTHDGDLKIEYKITDGLWGSNNVKTNDIHAGVAELLRRNGFDETHKPLCLPKYETPVPVAPVNDTIAQENAVAAESDIKEDEGNSLSPGDVGGNPMDDSGSDEVA